MLSVNWPNLRFLLCFFERLFIECAGGDGISLQVVAYCAMEIHHLRPADLATGRKVLDRYPSVCGSCSTRAREELQIPPAHGLASPILHRITSLLKDVPNEVLKFMIRQAIHHALHAGIIKQSGEVWWSAW